ncbi:tRNA guanosine(34) transglycosylase Tgt [Skermania sp. ID1734]|uniref:tRNA guanosine(34) transglycosylase Tgt n=1 Tax=Skermania sp. ID1734 TaxID=2597516 RepID=UPI001181453A|nr:tRNA guanosine(34) transglycosylase Tgt [Skermania sp. ID1734]TSE00656.1 tRNA guanosine(34) transglycosylase Tgt [Skermania sp. ID1734]
MTEGRAQFGFRIGARLPGRHGRTGTIATPHGEIQTPAFIPVGTKATVKAVLPETMKELGAQALLANAYHLYLQPSPEIIDAAGGLGRFMNWDRPTFTDSGGFQVMSLGVGFKKVLAMEAVGHQSDEVIAKGRERLAKVDDDGVTFTSHLNGSRHRFTPEISMQIQHQLGADIMFAFDELTTLFNTREYQETSLQRTHDWAVRCMDEHDRLTETRRHRPYQALFAVIQGAQYEDLRRKACRGLASITGPSGNVFDGYGIGGAIEKHNLGAIVGWCSDELPEDKPRHMLGISEPEDLFEAIANGADTFDCVNPSRTGRNGRVYTLDGRFNVDTSRFRRDFTPIDDACDCYTCGHYTKAYLHHLFKAKEMLAATLCTVHNERFTIRLVDAIRDSITDGTFDDFHEQAMARWKN